MNEWSVTQEYYLLALNEKGIISSFYSAGTVCLVASGLLELKLNQCIDIKENVVSVHAEIPNRCIYLRPLYEYIQEKGSCKIEKIVEVYISSSKKINELIQSIEHSFLDKAAFHVVNVGILKNKERMVPTKETRTLIIDKIHASLLKDGIITNEIAILIMLLDKSGYLKIYFSKFDQKNLKDQLKKLAESPDGNVIKMMIKYMDASTAIIAIMATT